MATKIVYVPGLEEALGRLVGGSDLAGRVSKLEGEVAKLSAKVEAAAKDGKEA